MQTIKGDQGKKERVGMQWVTWEMGATPRERVGAALPLAFQSIVDRSSITFDRLLVIV